MKTSDDELTKLADAAFKLAAKDVTEIAIRTGTPIIGWKNGAVTKVYPKKKASTARVDQKIKK